jgi:DNA-binding transcriptional LysR family regulator
MPRLRLATGVREASLHRAVADLSIGIGQRLVERRGRGIALTARGHVLARRFRLAEAELRAGGRANSPHLRGAKLADSS